MGFYVKHRRKRPRSWSRSLKLYLAIIVICLVIGAAVHLLIEAGNQTSIEAQKLKELDLEKTAREKFEKEKIISQSKKTPPVQEQEYVTPENLRYIYGILRDRLDPEDIERIRKVYRELSANKP